MRLSFFVLNCCLVVSSAGAAADPLCDAINGLRVEAVRSGRAQQVAIFKVEPMTVGCQRNRSIAAQDAFCGSATEAAGVEFTHVFPWKVYDCLKVQGLKPGITTVDQYTGLNRKKAVHLWAGWHDGTRIDIVFQPMGNFSNQPKFKDYWGVYRIVVWRP